MEADEAQTCVVPVRANPGKESQASSLLSGSDAGKTTENLMSRAGNQRKAPDSVTRMEILAT